MALTFFREMPVKLRVSCFIYLRYFFPPYHVLFSCLMSGYLCQPQGRESYDLENKDGILKFHWLGQICWFSALAKHAFEIAVMFLVACCSPSLALGFLKIKVHIACPCFEA